MKRKDRVLILKYKISFEEEIDAKEELSQGTADLSNHLLFFQKKLSQKKPEQIAAFNKLFFEPQEIDQTLSAIDTIDEKCAKEEKASSSENKKWAKRLYKKIVALTHPDKISSIKIISLLEKLESYYMLAVDSYKQENYHNLIMIAFDLDIDFDNDLVVKEIFPAFERSKKSIIITKSKIGYQWYHIPDDNKRSSLEKYLTDLGFTFTEDELTSAIEHASKKRLKRKPGTRPIKMFRNRTK